MKRIDDDLMTQLMLSNPPIARLTEETIASALLDFPLEASPGLNWLARAIQGALHFSIRWGGDPDRPSNVEIRDELHGFADNLSALWLSLSQRSNAADDALWDYAFRNWSHEGDEVLNHLIAETPPSYRRFGEAIAQLGWLAGYLRRASAAQEPQKPNWRRAEGREERIMRAQCLSIVYEFAFDAAPTLNRWPTSKSLGNWADFYQRIVALAFDEKATPNLEDVLREARRRQTADATRVVFAPGILPDKPL
jgi:hypothetical protein